jgi:hypothetical protein
VDTAFGRVGDLLDVVGGDRLVIRIVRVHIAVPAAASAQSVVCGREARFACSHFVGDCPGRSVAETVGT